MTAEERRLRDKKHLNDITAARLPPLHHSPAKLLSIEESIAIQIQQKEAYEVRIYDLSGKVIIELPQPLQNKQTDKQKKPTTIRGRHKGIF